MEALRALQVRASDDHWTSALLDAMRSLTQRSSFAQAFGMVLWITIWLLGWGLMWPLLRWPFGDAAQVGWAASLYAIGGLLLPVLIAWRTLAQPDSFWKESRPSVVRGTVAVFTHQGAAMGFHIA